ncbi:hypothetical protein L2E82_00149 [Cichorium intybus]|uniref:Uncharacterized protein n=1 Tax=Cichorium intybus TaxID=13427 RepID=A0ACB9GXG2_CICIN|nr:hypothetical protein L2E82_00149 [Cichorium intybus]
MFNLWNLEQKSFYQPLREAILIKGFTFATSVVKSKVAAAENISQFNEEARSPSHADLVLTGHVDNVELVGTFNIIWKSTFTALISNINVGLRE